MIICPVCEHQQAQGDECENCGKKLAVAPAAAAAAPVARLPDLELTRVAGPAQVAVAPLPELEATRMAGPAQVAVAPVPELETTRQAQVAAVQVAPVQDLELTRAPADGQRTAAPTGAVVCRYCRNVQASGLLCDKCGMRLPRVRATEASAKPAARKGGGDPQWVRCSKCNTPTQTGRACTTCGTVNEAEA